MIVANLKNLTYPLDTSALFWISGAPSGPAAYNPASFYFASADGSRLVSAMLDEERFIAALTTEIASLAGLSCVAGLQALLDALIADNTPPAPIYPEIGDTNVKGLVVRVFGGTWFTQLQSPTPPPGWGNPANWKGPRWCGIVIAYIAANGYSTPPAKLVEAWSQEIGQWRFSFNTSTAVECGPCTFDIVQGYDFTGAPSCAVARNVVNT